jgi:hypothetical protein
MAVVAVNEVIAGTGVSGKYGETFVFTRKWRIRVDDPKTSQVIISRAAGITFGSGHPDFGDHKAMEFDLADEDGVGMFWMLTVKYYIPPKDNTPDSETGLPKPDWRATGSTTTIPAFKDNEGYAICNSANDPLEGLEIEASDFGLTLTKCYADLSWVAIATSRSNAVNSDTWNGSAARTWKAEFRGAVKKEMTVSASSGSATLPYWETSWEFRYREDTWDLKPWDVGFNQLVTSDGTPSAAGTKKAAILGGDKRPVKSPVALFLGVAMSAGSKPDVKTFKVYKEQAFSVFGVPS